MQTKYGVTQQGVACVTPFSYTTDNKAAVTYTNNAVFTGELVDAGVAVKENLAIAFGEPPRRLQKIAQGAGGTK
jgi:hypothetical protein